MSGHSKWANIQHRKGRQDAKRGKVFTKIAKELTVAAKAGGKDLNFNPRLRLAIEKAKSENMPKDNIDRAIKKGTGELEGVEYVEIRYEGYGPEGVAFVVEALTDNKNRTASSVRSTFSKNGGNLGETGSVGWMFDKRGLISFAKGATTEEELMDIALEAGAEDIKEEDGAFSVITDIADFMAVKIVLDENGFKYEQAEITMIPQNTVSVTDEDKVNQLMKLFETLDDDDDVQDVYANFDISEELLEKIFDN